MYFVHTGDNEDDNDPAQRTRPTLQFLSCTYIYIYVYIYVYRSYRRTLVSRRTFKQTRGRGRKSAHANPNPLVNVYIYIFFEMVATLKAAGACVVCLWKLATSVTVL